MHIWAMCLTVKASNEMGRLKLLMRKVMDRVLYYIKVMKVRIGMGRIKTEKDLERAMKKICTSGEWHKSKEGFHANGKRKKVDGEAGRILEELLGIQPNNKRTADLVLSNGTRVEIKTNKSKTPITLGCLAPMRLIPQRQVIQQYGIVHPDACRFNATLKATGNLSRGLVIEYKSKTIDVVDSVTRTGVMSWKISDVVNKFTNKIPNVLHVKAVKRKVEEREEYKFVSSTYYSKFSPLRFEQQLSQGEIVIEPREKIDYTKNNKIRDRGTAFRVGAKNLNEMFNKSVAWVVDISDKKKK